MLDKSIVYKNIIMRGNMTMVTARDVPKLPKGYSYKFYKPGDMQKWAEIEFSIGEFSSADNAADYFFKKYLPFEDQMKERCQFIVDDCGQYVATAMAWYFNDETTRWPALNWVGVKPSHQGYGLGKAIIQKTLSLFPLYENGPDIWLHTQTWSHKAIGIYLNFGFYALKTKRMAHYKNDFSEAVGILKDVMPNETFRIFMETAK